MQQTTHQYEFSSNAGHPGAPFHMTREFGSEPQQSTTYEYSSRSVGHPGQSLEHAHSAQNITKTYEFSGAPNFGGSSNQGSTTYEYTRTVGHPSQISYEIPKSSYAPERHSAYETRVYTQTYGGEQVVRSKPSPAKQVEQHSDVSSERDPDTIDFNHDELVDLMAEEHRHIRGTEPVIITTTKDITPITYTTDLKYSTADLLKSYPNTGTTVTYTVEKEKKSSAPVNVDVEVVGSTHLVEPIVTTNTTTQYHTTQYHHVEPVNYNVEEWSKKKYLTTLADPEEEEVEEARLDYCGLCVSKRRYKKSKY